MSAGGNGFSQNHAAHVLIAGAILITWSVYVFCIRLHLRVSTKRLFGSDDLACTIAMILGLISTSLTFAAVHAGLGKHQDTRSPAQLASFLKLTYAASILYILAICASKCSISLLVARLTPARQQRLPSHSVTCFTMVWGLVSCCVILFQCRLPNPWDTVSPGSCTNLLAKWSTIEVFSSIIEVALFGLAVHLLWSLHMPLQSKGLILGIFCSRLLVIIPIGYRIYYLRGALSGSDITFTSTNAAIVTQVVLHFSIMADTFPCMKPFLVAFDKGLDDGSSRYYAQQRGYILHSVGDDSTKPGTSQTWPDRVKTETNVEHTPIRPPTTATRSSPGDSSELMIIRKTQEWQITNEPAR